MNSYVIIITTIKNLLAPKLSFLFLEIFLWALKYSVFLSLLYSTCFFLFFRILNVLSFIFWINWLWFTFLQRCNYHVQQPIGVDKAHPPPLLTPVFILPIREFLWKSFIKRSQFSQCSRYAASSMFFAQNRENCYYWFKFNEFCSTRTGPSVVSRYYHCKLGEHKNAHTDTMSIWFSHHAIDDKKR